MQTPRLLVVVVAMAVLSLGCASDESPSGSDRPVVINDSTRAEAQDLVGRHIEDGIDWAEERGLEWRLTVIGGRQVDDSAETRPGRVSFETDGDLIVAVELS